MAKVGKKFQASSIKRDSLNRYSIEEAIDLIKEMAYTKFDESVDLAVKLGVDPRHADQMVRGACVLPHGTGKTIRVLVFAKGDKAKEAEEAGADVVGAEELVKQIQDGWLEFDKAVATPDMMKFVGRLGKILGRRGMMPNPKVGTVTFDVAQAVKELKGGRIEFRVEKAGIIHAPIGRLSFESSAIKENASALLDSLHKAKPASSKGTYVKGVTISSTMGPGVRIDPLTI